MDPVAVLEEADPLRVAARIAAYRVIQTEIKKQQDQQQ